VQKVAKWVTKKPIIGIALIVNNAANELDNALNLMHKFTRRGAALIWF